MENKKFDYKSFGEEVDKLVKKYGMDQVLNVTKKLENELKDKPVKERIRILKLALELNKILN